MLRAKRPLVPIMVTGPYYNPSEDIPGDAGKRQIEKRAFEREHVAAGDTRMAYIDGLEMLGREQADGLVDAPARKPQVGLILVCVQDETNACVG